jgi:hypothetical protein
LTNNLPVKHDMEEVVRVLTELVNCRGNMLECQRRTGLNYHTIRTWAQVDYADRYMEIEEAFGREIEQQIVMEARETAHLAAAAARDGVKKLHDEIVEGKITGHYLGQATYSLAKIANTNVDQVLKLTGRPTNPTQGTADDAMKVLRELSNMGLISLPAVKVDAETTATEE